MTLRSVVAFTAVLGLFTLAAPTPAHGGDGAAGPKGPFPAGYNGLMVFMATGALPLSDGFFLDGMIFQQQIMNRTPAQIAENRAAALAFFQERFGLANADSHPDLFFFGFYVDPRIHYRAYVISGRHVPPEGFQVHDGGWAALVTHPAGLTLGGAFAGRHVPQNTLFTFGDYHIEVTRPGRGAKPSPLIVHFRCLSPLVPTFTGGEAFDCAVTSDEFGEGLAQGVNTPTIENGALMPNGRTVITFSDRGGL